MLPMKRLILYWSDPTYNYAHLNRGIALYYGGRAKLAQDDLLAFYQDDPNDPFRSLWLYIAERKLDEKRRLKHSESA